MEPKDRDRFWAKVSVGGVDECWPWQAARKRRGLPYGKFWLEGGEELAHRAAYRAAIGPIPRGECVLHSCDNPPCCNPRHLFLGSLGDNNRDRAEKGRSCKGTEFATTHQALWRRGAKNNQFGRTTPTTVGTQAPNAKLSDDEVLEIRALRGSVPNVELAARFGVSDGLISMIGTGKRWKHLL